MDPQFLAIFEGFAVQNGTWRVKPGGARLVENSSRASAGKPEKLALVIEILSESPVAAILYDRLFAAFSGAYSRAEGTLTMALREAFASANELVLDINRRSDQAHQLLVGIEAAAIRQKDVFIAQVGPVAAALWHDDQLSLDPPSSPWIFTDQAETNPEREPALGEGIEIKPHFSRVTLDPGDALLLCNAALIRDINDNDLALVLGASHQGSLASILGPLLQYTPAVGMMITVPEAKVKNAQPSVQPETQTATPPLPVVEPVTSGSPAQPQAEVGWQKQGRLLGSSVLIIAAAAIPLVLMVMVIAARLQYDHLRKSEFDEVRTTAHVQYEAALATDDQLAQRRAMNDALQRTEEALLALPGDEDLLSLRQRAINRLDTLNNVSRLYRLTKLVDLDDPEMATSMSRIIVAGQDVYLLNRGSNRVYHLLLNDTGDVMQLVTDESLIVQPGLELGGVKVEHLVDIAWMDADLFVRRSQLFALERSGSIVVYDPETGRQGMSVMPVGNSDLWLGPQTMGKYEGNLYILDPLQSRILKYLPVEGAYILPPIDYLDPMLGFDLTGVIDMAIDGNIYLLFVDGRVVKFLEGIQQPFSMEGLPTAMTSPLAVCVTTDESPEKPGYVYVADPGSERILQFDKQGNYIRQFMTNPDTATLRTMQAFYIDEATGRLFVVSDGAIWLTTLPPLG